MAQNFQNHAKYVPVFHFLVLPVLLLNFGVGVFYVGPITGLIVALTVARTRQLLPSRVP